MRQATARKTPRHDPEIFGASAASDGARRNRRRRPCRARPPGRRQSPKTLAAISSAPLTIEADLFEIRQKDNKAVFSGNVRVSQGVLRMRAAKLVIFYRDKKKAAEEKSQPAEKNLDIVSMRASGGVRLFTPPSRSARDGAPYIMSPPDRFGWRAAFSSKRAGMFCAARV